MEVLGGNLLILAWPMPPPPKLNRASDLQRLSLHYWREGNSNGCSLLASGCCLPYFSLTDRPSICAGIAGRGFSMGSVFPHPRAAHRRSHRALCLWAKEWGVTLELS